MLALILAIGLAHGADGQSGWYLPGARPMESPSGSAGVVGGLLLSGYGSKIGTAGFEGSWAFADRFALFGFVLSDPNEAADLGPSGHVSVRWMAVDEPEVHVAPYLITAGVFGYEAFTSGVGIAIEAGWPFLRLDVTTPVLMLEAIRDQGQWDIGPQLTPRTFEAGITLVMDFGHRVRIGYPFMSYHLEREGFHLDFGAALMNAAPMAETPPKTAGLWVKLGFRL